MFSGGPNVLHVAAHLGGGVGRVLLNYLAAARDGRIRHRLWCLDYANPAARDQARAAGIELRDRLGLDHPALNRAAAGADLVVLHWWNHPLVYAWLCSGPWPPTRLLIWSHVSGLSAPQIITPELPALADILAVANPVSFRAPALAALDEAEKAGRLRLVFSSGGLAQVAGARLRPHPGLRVGYLGTVEYAKMHPDFVDLCLSAGLSEDAVFAVAGGSEEGILRAEIQRRGVAGRFEILGPIEDVAGFLSELDVFGYPLNPDHYGTGEQALIEAQAAGVPPVVLAGGAEEFVIEHEVTGLAARGLADYGVQLKRLAEDGDLRRKLSAGARERARERFGLGRTVAAFQTLYEELLDRPKQPRLWPGWSPGWSPGRIFLASQGRAAAFFTDLEEGGAAAGVEGLSRAGLSATRGSVFHYASFFPGDRRLKFWSSCLAAARLRPSG